MERKKFIDKIASREGRERYVAIIEYSRYLRQNDPDESAKQAKKVFTYAESENDIHLEITALINICNAYLYKPDFESLEEWVEKLFKVGKESNIPRAVGAAYNMRSRISFMQNDLTESLEYMLKAMEYYLRTQDKGDLISGYNALGMIHLQKNELAEAEHYINLAIETAEEIGSPAKNTLLVNVSHIQFDQGKFEESLVTNQKCLKYFHDNDMKNTEATILYNIGLCHTNLGRIPEALENLESSLVIYREKEDPDDMSKIYTALANTYMEKGDYKTSLEYIRKAEKTAKENDLSWKLMGAYDSYHRYFEKIGDHKNAYLYLSMLYALEKKLMKEVNQEKLTELETKYKTKMYQLKTAELNLKNQSMSNQIKELNQSLKNLQKINQKLQEDVQQTIMQMNDQEDIVSSQTRMNVMDEMISSIAHQWKQPLNVIWVLAQAIKDAWDYEELNNEFLENQISQIGEQVHYMSETIGDFRDFFKPGSEKEFKVAEVVERSIRLSLYLLKRHNITLIKELNEHCILRGNPNELGQVLINLINNARQAIVSNGVIEPRIKITLNCNNGKVNLLIFNNGKTIPVDQKKKLFKPYYTTRGKEGTGLGLYICRQIIENKFNGMIKVKNHSDGVEFCLEMNTQNNLSD